MVVRKLVQEILVPNPTAERGMAVALIQENVWLIEKSDKDQQLFHMYFATKHTTGMAFAK